MGYGFQGQGHRDVDEAVAHYLIEAGEAVAMGFIEALEKAYGHIGRHPATGSPRHAHETNLPGLRGWPLTRYPQIVFYVEHSDHIDVWLVVHGQRDIPVWMQEPENVWRWSPAGPEPYRTLNALLDAGL